MRIISAPSELKDTITSYKKNDKTIGFVPTMGALHDGHLSLIKKSIDQNDCTVVSIFVNPLQFNNSSDLAKYPRVIEEDIKLLKSYDVNVVFTPSEDDLYPRQPMISINFGDLSKRLEGEFRKGHFEGVGVIVSKLLHLTSPDFAYFGLKDLQQYILIRTLCEELDFPTNVVGVETVREDSGLALSSRNRRLSESGLNDASIIYQELKKIKEGIELGTSLKDLLSEARASYKSSPGFELEYLEAVNPINLQPVEEYSSLNELAVCVAGYVEGVRLIDNLYLRLK
ncbi:pantoate--beta-alanine ligase [Ekhidna sp.]|uniref:pantoate--beta-alanine ligase n=1 Tax=Ekhidna sp. TaxID=2608089 RepID=UPI003CCC085E